MSDIKRFRELNLRYIYIYIYIYGVCLCHMMYIDVTTWFCFVLYNCSSICVLCDVCCCDWLQCWCYCCVLLLKSFVWDTCVVSQLCGLLWQLWFDRSQLWCLCVLMWAHWYGEFVFGQITVVLSMMCVNMCCVICVVAVRCVGNVCDPACIDLCWCDVLWTKCFNVMCCRMMHSCVVFMFVRLEYMLYIHADVVVLHVHNAMQHPMHETCLFVMCYQTSNSLQIIIIQSRVTYNANIRTEPQIRHNI